MKENLRKRNKLEKLKMINMRIQKIRMKKTWKQILKIFLMSKKR